MILKQQAKDGSPVIIKCAGTNKDSLYIVPGKSNKKYPLAESSLHEGKY
ncbi:MAG: hypothetical protein ABJB86_21620 [Bacteroidota bacterium]